MRNEADTPTPDLDAQLLACHILDTTRSRLYAFQETPVSVEQSRSLDDALTRRLNAEPVAYIVGYREFWSTPLHTSPDALVPRADTEVLVEKALELEPQAPPGTVLDLGTGSGAIAIAVAQEIPTRDIIAIEHSALAAGVARTNIHAQSTGNIQLVQASWLDAIADSEAAMVLSNPPYLASDDPHLQQLMFEPHDALVSGPDGLEDLRHIITETVRVAKPEAPLIVEHGCTQGADVRQLMLDSGYAGVDTGRDLAGLERISFGFVVKSSG